MKVYHFLVGGWTNPSEKSARQIGSFPQVEVKIKDIWNHHLDRIYITEMVKTEICQNKWCELEIYPPTQDAGSSPPGLLIIYIFRLGNPYKPLFATVKVGPYQL